MGTAQKPRDHFFLERRHRSKSPQSLREVFNPWAVVLHGWSIAPWYVPDLSSEGHWAGNFLFVPPDPLSVFCHPALCPRRLPHRECFHRLLCPPSSCEYRQDTGGCKERGPEMYFHAESPQVSNSPCPRITLLSDSFFHLTALPTFRQLLVLAG